MKDTMVLIDLRFFSGVWFIAGIMFGSVMGAVIALLFRGSTDC